MDRHAAIRPAPLGLAFSLVGATVVFAQTMPGLETKKVKTIPIHRDGTSGQSFTPGAHSTSAPTPPTLDVPVVKVPTIRVKPTGEMTYPPPRDPADVDRK